MWGRARVVEDDPALLARLMDQGYRARPERAILFTVEAWDVNCSQHITARFTEAEVAEATLPLRERLAALEAENARLRAAATAQASVPPGLTYPVIAGLDPAIHLLRENSCELAKKDGPAGQARG